MSRLLSIHHTLSLHDALPIWVRATCRLLLLNSSQSSSCSRLRMRWLRAAAVRPTLAAARRKFRCEAAAWRSEEQTSELQSPCNLVCCLLLEIMKLCTDDSVLS